MESWTERIQGSKLCCFTRPVVFFWVYQMEGMQNLVLLHNTTRQLFMRLRAAAFAQNAFADAGSGAPGQPAPFRKFSAQQAQHMRRHLAQVFRQHATVTVGASGQLGCPTAGTY